MNVAMNENGIEIMNLMAAQAWLEELAAKIKKVSAVKFKAEFAGDNTETFGAVTVGYSAQAGLNSKATTKNSAIGQIECSLYSVGSELAALKAEMKPIKAEQKAVEVSEDELMDLFFG